MMQQRRDQPRPDGNPNTADPREATAPGMRKDGLALVYSSGTATYAHIVLTPADLIDTEPMTLHKPFRIARPGRLADEVVRHAGLGRKVILDLTDFPESSFSQHTRENFYAAVIMAGKKRSLSDEPVLVVVPERSKIADKMSINGFYRLPFLRIVSSLGEVEARLPENSASSR